MNSFSKISILLFVLGIFFNSCSSDNDRPYAVNGILNVTDYHLNQDIIKLDGKWEFYWNRLISPEDFRKKRVEESIYSNVPDIWNDLTKENSSISGQGFATYRLQIYNQSSDSEFGIRLNRINVAYKLWINGELLAENGKVASNKEEVIPSRKTTTHYFNADSDIIEIVLQLSNFNQKNGGIENSILFGNEKKMQTSGKRGMALNFFLFGLLLIVAINHLILYKLRSDVTSSLYFSLLIFSITFSFAISGNHNITSIIFPDLDWNILMKLDYIGDYLSLFFFLKYISSLFKEEISRLTNKIATIVILTMILFVLITSPAIFTYTVILSYIITSALVLYISFVLAKAIVSKKEGAKQALLGTFILAIAILNDSLNNHLIINTYYLLPYGLAIFIILQSYLISFRLSKAYQYSVQLTDELDYFNENLEKLVKDRTSQIEQQKEELEVQSESILVANDEIVKINQILEGQSIEINKKNKAVTDSINYAKRLQEAVMPEEMLLKDNFPNHFIFFKPKDIVSGDFYWYGEVDSSWDFDESNKIKIIIAADCTGHGVPGAFMTLLGHNFLHMIVNIQEVVDPEQILYKLDQLVIETLKQKESGTMKDGMDISVLTVDEDKKAIAFAGAGNPLFYIRDGELIEIKGSNFGIGGVLRKEKIYLPHKIEYKEGDIFYIFSDGFADQIGGPDGRKFYKRRLKEILIENHKKPVDEQKEILNKAFEEWKGDKKQIDDVLVMGIRM